MRGTESVDVIAPPRVRAPSRRMIAVVMVGLIVYGVVVPTIVAEAIGPARNPPATSIGVVASGVLFLQAGLLLLLTWRLTGRRWAATAGVAALVYGAMVIPMTELAGLAGGDQAATQRHLVAQSAVALVAVSLFGAGALGARRGKAVRPLRLMAGAAVACIVLVLGMTLPLPSASSARAVAIALGATASLAWLLLAAAQARLRWSGADAEPEVVWAALVFGALALGGVADIGSLFHVVPYSLDGAALAILGGALLAGAAGYQVLSDLAANEDRVLTLRSLLDGVEAERTAREERAHDAQAALMAVRTAVTALRRYRERLDASARSQLELAVESELSLLADLVNAPAHGERTDGPVDVAGAVEVVAAVARNLGSQVTVDLPSRGCWAVGRHNDLVRVLQTLLDNCRKHAPGSPVTIAARDRGGAVQVTVADRGPGVPDDKKQAVFARGGRGAGTTVAGSGLGLFIASQLIARQGGAIEVYDRLGGGAAFVLTLRAATPAEVGTLPSPPLGRVRTPRYAPAPGAAPGRDPARTVDRRAHEVPHGASRPA